jgi:hypothetical protein
VREDRRETALGVAVGEDHFPAVIPCSIFSIMYG